MLYKKPLLPKPIKPVKTRKKTINKKPFHNGHTPTEPQIERARQIFKRIATENVRRSENIEIVAQAIAKEGNMMYNTAYRIAGQLIINQQIKQI